MKVDGCDHKLTIKDAELGDADEYTAQLNEKTSTKAKLTVEGKILPEYNLLDTDTCISLTYVRIKGVVVQKKHSLY